jgi:hypothetical protein
MPMDRTSTDGADRAGLMVVAGSETGVLGGGEGGGGRGSAGDCFPSRRNLMLVLMMSRSCMFARSISMREPMSSIGSIGSISVNSASVAWSSSDRKLGKQLDESSCGR